MGFLYAVLLLFTVMFILTVSPDDVSSTWSTWEEPELSCCTSCGGGPPPPPPQCIYNPNHLLYPCNCDIPGRPICDPDGQCVADTFGQCAPCDKCATYRDPVNTAVCKPCVAGNPGDADYTDSCVTGCTCVDDNGCTEPERSRCKLPPPGRCVECLDDTDCTTLEKPLCDLSSNVCVECLSDTDCTTLEKPLCDLNSKVCVPICDVPPEKNTQNDICSLSCGASPECDGEAPEVAFQDGSSCDDSCIYQPPPDPCDDGVLPPGDTCTTVCGASLECHGRVRSDSIDDLPDPYGHCDNKCEYHPPNCPAPNGVCNLQQCPNEVDSQCDGKLSNDCTSSGSLGFCSNACRYDPNPDCCHNVCIGSGGDWFGSGVRCSKGNCCGDDTGESGRSRLTACGSSVNPNECPEFPSDSSDQACCSDPTDAVFDGTCYQSGKRPYTYSQSGGTEFMTFGRIPNVVAHTDGTWYDCDARQDLCEGDPLFGFCGLIWARYGGGVPRIGEYDSNTRSECCGDDKGEFYKNTPLGPHGPAACCGSFVNCVDETGACVGPDTTRVILGTTYVCQNGFWDGFNGDLCALIPGEPNDLPNAVICY